MKAALEDNPDQLVVIVSRRLDYASQQGGEMNNITICKVTSISVGPGDLCRASILASITRYLIKYCGIFLCNSTPIFVENNTQ